MSGGRVVTELLPFECWPTSDLMELLSGINDGLDSGRLDGHGVLVALSWGDSIMAELTARGLLGSAGQNRWQVRPPRPAR